jgi:nitrite reductase/ring-hydroxylating ferredoxin subunit
LGQKEICSENKQINGKIFYKTANVSELQEKKGKKFILDKVPVAVFKVEGEFHAYSNVCAHQKGPICKAAVDSEFIVCPWHNFQYKVKDGKGPVGFNDFIPYYQTSVEDEFVWVSLMN